MLRDFDGLNDYSGVPQDFGGFGGRRSRKQSADWRRLVEVPCYADGDFAWEADGRYGVAEDALPHMPGQPESFHDIEAHNSDQKWEERALKARIDTSAEYISHLEDVIQQLEDMVQGKAKTAKKKGPAKGAKKQPAKKKAAGKKKKKKN